MRLLTHLRLAAHLKSWHQLQTMNSASASQFSAAGGHPPVPALLQHRRRAARLPMAGAGHLHACALAAPRRAGRYAQLLLDSLLGPCAVVWVAHPSSPHMPLLQRKLSPSCHCAGQPAYQPATSGVVNAGLAQLAAVHEALEDVTRGLPEAAREAAAVGVLAAAGAAVMRAHMRAGAADELLALRCLQPLVSGECNRLIALGAFGGHCSAQWCLPSLLCRAQPMLAKSALWCLGCCRLVCLQVDVGPAVAAPAFKPWDAGRGMTTCYTRSLLRRAHSPHPGPPQTLAPLTQGVRKLAAAAELLERAARSMRLPADGWARAMWAVLSTLRL